MKRDLKKIRKPDDTGKKKPACAQVLISGI